MSLTSQQLLDIAEAVNDVIVLGTNIDYAFPSPFEFADKAGIYSAVNEDIDTKTEIEIGLLRASWLRYLTFEDLPSSDERDDARELDGPVRELVYEQTIFHESTFQRIDETDAFNKQVRKTYHEHVTTIMSLAQPGITPIPALLGTYAIAEYITPAQIDNTEYKIACDYIPSLTGHQSKLEWRIRVELPC
jgi:hypothetical protein